MKNVFFEQRTIHGNKNCIALYRRDDDIDDDEIFAFSDEAVFSTASDICDALVTDNEICAGYIGNAPCLFLFEDCTSNTAKVFYFKNDSDLCTACEMANRYLEMKDSEDEDGENADEIDSENQRQDAYDDARHVYEAAIEKGYSEKEAREKASRILDAQLNG